MSTRPETQSYSESIENDEAAREYLTQNPEFFVRHPELLQQLRIPHERDGAVSLVEKQLSVLRQKDLKHERKLKELLKIARDNDLLIDKMHSLTLKLLATKDLSTSLVAIESSLRVDFSADQSILVMFGDPEQYADVRHGRFFRVVQPDDERLKAFSTFLEGNLPRCGQVRDAQRDFLFGVDTNEIGSVALVPLATDISHGFLAIGSNDEKRFNPGMSIDFLRRIGEITTEALRRY